ncbi:MULTISPECIES: hypothetical protein [unclassified Caballeronia]|uniref:hypothetical protein n=1 Tax=unclassified Caballeronia TaxID=2646786 RepID=UPI002866A46A|nr:MULTISPECIES: hypothetical protein [unclassified Caballeronia]MDR5770865.1 hypothetical protein [Caballeronia sp. LZ002]MDR5846302.1 hypothetical protein [Caballeronia sp. LZ003]
MNKYLARLKGLGETSTPSVSSVSDPGGSFRKTQPAQASQENDDVVSFDIIDLCAGALMVDGPYLPWGPYLTPEQLAAMQQAVIEVVTELSRIERWRDDYYDMIVVEIKRQPISTLLPDLDYFRARLAAARSQ